MREWLHKTILIPQIIERKKTIVMSNDSRDFCLLKKCREYANDNVKFIKRISTQRQNNNIIVMSNDSRDIWLIIILCRECANDYINYTNSSNNRKDKNLLSCRAIVETSVYLKKCR